MTNSNSSEGKKKVREELHNFIRLHYTPQQLQRAKVLTLISDKPYELEQVWNRLGVPRANITTVERNPETRERIRQSNSGIRIIENYSSIDNYIADTDEKFDIINLDYCGTLNSEQVNTLINISSKNMFREKGVLATWFSGRREKEEVQDYLKSSYNGIMTLAAGLNLENSLLRQPDKERLNEIINDGKYLSELELERSDSITNAILRHFTFPVTEKERATQEKELPRIIHLLEAEEKFVNALENTDMYKNSMKDILNTFIKFSLDEKLLMNDFSNKKIAEYYLNIRRKATARKQPEFKDRLGLAKFFIGGNEAHNIMLSIVENWVKKELDSKRIIYNINDPGFIKNVAHTLLYQDVNYLIHNNARFFYRGDSSTPMYADFVLFGKKEFKDFYWHTKNGKLKLHTGTLENFGYREEKRFDDYLALMQNTNVLFMESRKRIELNESDNNPENSTINSLETIADSYKINNNPRDIANTSPDLEIVSKDKIYSLLREGKTVDEINILYPEYTKKRIGSYKAWITMKENRENSSDSEANPSITSDSLDSTFSKEDAILFLRDGHTPQEIADAFNVPVWKIRGYKASETRKLNKEKEQYNKAS